MKNNMMPLNIQLFADGEGTEPVTQTEPKTEGTGAEPVKQTEPKTFTQEEVNALEMKWKAKMPSKEELTEFKEWKESKKTNEEKMAELLKENAKLKNDLVFSDNKLVVANAGVNPKFQKFVLSEVSDMEGDFEENLAKYLKDNSQYLNETSSTPKSTGMNQNGTNPKVSDEKAYLDKKYANNPYYKK